MDEWIRRLRTSKWAGRFVVGLRVLMAVGFIPPGLTKLLDNRFTILGVDTPIGYFFDALYQTGFYYQFIGLSQVLAGVLLLIPRFATLGALIYFPIIINIFVITVSMHFQGTPVITSLMLLAITFLLWWDFDRLRPIVAGPRSISPA
jgi:uncharacterized membrane protein YphA (DoxX/SURF4 family)